MTTEAKYLNEEESKREKTKKEKEELSSVKIKLPLGKWSDMILIT